MAGRTARGLVLCFCCSALAASEPPPDLAFLEFLAEWGSEEASTVLDKELARPETDHATDQQEVISE